MDKVWIHTSTLFIEQLFQHRFRLLVLEQVGQTWFKPKLELQSLEASYIGAGFGGIQLWSAWIFSRSSTS